MARHWTFPNQSPPRPFRRWACFKTNPSTTGVTRQPPAPMSTTKDVWRPKQKELNIGVGAKNIAGASIVSMRNSVRRDCCSRSTAAAYLVPCPLPLPMICVSPGVTASIGWIHLALSVAVVLMLLLLLLLLFSGDDEDRNGVPPLVCLRVSRARKMSKLVCQSVSRASQS